MSNTDKQPLVVEQNVRPVIRRLLCPDCNVDMLRANFDILLTFPPKVSYTCPKCGMTHVSSESYPRIEWITEEGEIVYV